MIKNPNPDLCELVSCLKWGACTDGFFWTVNPSKCEIRYAYFAMLFQKPTIYSVKFCTIKNSPTLI